MNTNDLIELRLAEQDKALAEAKRIAETVAHRLDQIETASDYFTIAGWYRYVRGITDLDRLTLIQQDKQATAFCSNNNVPMGSAPDPRFGRSNTYPRWVLKQLFAEIIN